MNPRLAALGLASWCAVAVAESDGWAKPAADAAPPPAYVAKDVITAKDGDGAILGFCVPTGGGLVAVTGRSERYGAKVQRAEDEESPPHRLAWFDADGEEVRSVDLDFAATCVAAAPDGSLLVAGDGVVARLTAAGQEVARAATPGAPQTDEQRAELERSMIERRDAQLAAVEKQIERHRDAVAELEENVQEAVEAAKKDAETEAADEEQAKLAARQAELQVKSARTRVTRMKQQLRQAEAQAGQLRRQDPRQIVDAALRESLKVRAVSAGQESVFVVTRDASGYGYNVWRLDARLESPERILSKLRGCCGQMDVQVIGERLAIAQNCKHCVELASFTGEVLGTVGGRASGADPTGFGGCCNPMNTCVAPDGSLLTSESNGVVKRFAADGSFVEIVGKAAVTAGCKNSAIAIEPDGSRLYYMDVTRGRVLVLTKAEDVEATDVDEDS